jgi:hypothetical protein
MKRQRTLTSRTWATLRVAAALLSLSSVTLANAAMAGDSIRTIDSDGEREAIPEVTADAVVHLSPEPRDMGAGTMTLSPSTPSAAMDLQQSRAVWPSKTRSHTAVFGSNLVPAHVRPYGARGAYPSQSRVADSASSGLDRAMPLWPVVQTLANQLGVDPALAMGVIETESGFRQQAISPKGAIGLMQIMPGTATRLGINPHDPLDNLFGGVRYLSWLLHRYQGNESFALAGYNAGEKAVDNYRGIPPYAETTAYVARVLDAKRRWSLLSQPHL